MTHGISLRMSLKHESERDRVKFSGSIIKQIYLVLTIRSIKMASANRGTFRRISSFPSGNKMGHRP